MTKRERLVSPLALLIIALASLAHVPLALTHLGTVRNNVAPGYWWNDAGLRRLAWHLFVLQMGSIVVG